MTVICCSVCRADPAARWVSPPAMIFIEPDLEGPERYRCRAHATPAKEEQLKSQEKELGLQPGGLR
jgi:hypothetical protein